MTKFIELCARAKKPVAEFSDIIIAYLGEYPFDTFELVEDGIKAYGKLENFETINFEAIEASIARYSVGNAIIREIPKENWNELWEKNYFEPVKIGNKVSIRAEFHAPDLEAELEIVIQPRMSFGTGHHATTQLMIGLLLEQRVNLKNAIVLDMGAGTGVLAIVAEKLGAQAIDAVDIEDWSVLNIMENSERNNCSKIAAFHGDVSFLDNVGNKYNFVLANIHKKVLLEDGKHYFDVMAENAKLLISGFYFSDLADIQKYYENLGCALLEYSEESNWCAAAFTKLAR